jgi:pyrimidine-specific ribonucleoside hydrolase
VYPDAAARGGNATAAAEFNAWSDPEAAHAVLTSTLPTVLVGLDVTLPTVLGPAGIARFAAAGPIGATAAAILQQYLDVQKASGGAGVVVHDALALTVAIAPGTLGTVRRNLVVDTSLGATRGQTLVDRRGISTEPSAVDVAETVDSAAAVEFLVSRLAALDRTTG